MVLGPAPWRALPDPADPVPATRRRRQVVGGGGAPGLDAPRLVGVEGRPLQDELDVVGVFAPLLHYLKIQINELIN